MKIAIDKATMGKVKITNKDDYIYVFNDETLEELLNLGLHCILKEKIDYVDINLTSQDINCLKKANIDDKDWNKVPPKKDYKFAVIVPNYNNDHRII